MRCWINAQGINPNMGEASQMTRFFGGKV